MLFPDYPTHCTNAQPTLQFERHDSIQVGKGRIVDSSSRRVRPKIDEDDANAMFSFCSFPSPFPAASESSLSAKLTSTLEVVNTVDVAATPWTDDDVQLLTLMRPFLDAQVAQEAEAMTTQTIAAAPSPTTVVQPHRIVSGLATKDMLEVSPSVPVMPLPTPRFASSCDGPFPQPVTLYESSWGSVDSSCTQATNHIDNSISSFLKSVMPGPPASRKRSRSDYDAQEKACITAPPSPVVTSVAGKTAESENAARFHKNQCGNWQDKFAELKVFKARRGHCNIPNVWAENPALALWVKRQRYQYKLKQEGKHSTMTDERRSALESLGFVWDSHAAAWDEKFHELCVFRAERGHCNVPANWVENRPLAIWVKCQRRQYVLRTKNGKTEKMSDDRISLLQSIGFVFCPRGQKS